MPMTDALLPEFDHEMANTRKVLERVPEDRLDWRPHPKSWTMGALATHVAALPGWAVETLQRTELDVMPGGKPGPSPAEVKSRSELLERFDKNAGAGQAIMTLPRAAVLRSFVLSHLIHHRAQLGVYLRLNDIPVPSIYGPSADEGAF
jgi:uncharacterized damage-inducible protein DinB